MKHKVIASLVNYVRPHSCRGRGSLIAGLSIIAGFYTILIFADFLAPYDYREQSLEEPLAPPTTIRFRDNEGRWHIRPFIYAQRMIDPLERQYQEDPQRSYRLEFFASGHRYKILGLTTDRHLIGVVKGDNGVTPRVHLLGTDVLGRDRLSRLLQASRFSLLVGPLSTLIASAIGILIGCLAGYGRGRLDAIIMRIADTMMALPTLVLILAARAAFPLELPPWRAAILLITIFVTLGWAEMARLTRGLVMEMRERDFVLAAISLGLSPGHVLWRHILPNVRQPLTVNALLMLPAFLLAETALSFFGIGVQEPEASWGSMLTAASEITLLERGHILTLIAPAFAIMLFMLGVRLLSNGLDREQYKDQETAIYRRPQLASRA
jgi:peptide/nickel transport system permease protein